MRFKWGYWPETPGPLQTASKSRAEGSVPARIEQAVGAVRGLRGWAGKRTKVRIQRSLGEATVQTEGIPPKIRVEDEKARRNNQGIFPPVAFSDRPLAAL